MRINTNNQNFKGGLNSTLGQFYNPNAVLPALIIETGVTLGRTAMAQKRGGKRESIERFVEQGTSAVVWIWGVQFLKKIGEFFGEKILKNEFEKEGIKSFKDFDIGFDEFRNPTSFIKSQKLKNFKSANILLSTLFATFFIGFILPKISTYIAKKASVQKRNNKIKTPSLEEYKNNLSFKGLGNNINLMAHILENNQTARLLITDTGVIAGRCHNAKNKYKKIEGLFRDTASIYLYLRATKDIATLLNKLAKNTDIDPNVLDMTVEKYIQNGFNKDFKPEYLKEIYNNATKGAYNNPLKFVSSKKIKETDKSIENFLEQIKGIKDEKIIRNIARSNKIMNLSFHITGVIISIFGLSYVIPKIQYFITKKLTNENKFPDSD